MEMSAKGLRKRGAFSLGPWRDTPQETLERVVAAKSELKQQMETQQMNEMVSVGVYMYICVWTYGYI